MKRTDAIAPTIPVLPTLTISQPLLDTAIYYSSIFLPIIGYTLLFGYLFTNNDVSALATPFDRALFYSKFFWFTGALVVIANLIGLIAYGSPRRKEQTDRARFLDAGGWNANKRLIVTYVSRGDNYRALERSIHESSRVLTDLGVDYMIDVVTDMTVADKMKQALNTHFHVVPAGYSTMSDTKYKARALHYLVEERQKPHHHSAGHPDTWILHLDEESTVTESSVVGIHEFINTPANADRIGQGEIKYNAHQYNHNIFITAADSIRTGDDLGRFRFQYKATGRPLFGMHGSYVLVPSAIEHAIGFDLSPKQSITEDAYFAFKAADRHVKFAWVDGYVREQSPFTILDVLKQRRRWFNGLMYLALDGDIRLRTRLTLILNMMLWTVAWLGPIVTIVNIMAGGGYFPTSLAITAALLQGGYAAIYLVGAYRNLLDTNYSAIKKFGIYVATFLLTPFVNVIEGLAVLYALVSPVRGFHVVQKN